eukprot:CAMPEP_0179153064 /NCGR_PEP_ID=MMETSP0796-20121207/74411_1 /TAXON_ID=73915 /ORGANISM="Pyrodinium bahamense, Strain pbaha01" /LENGTH=256 /DNA_ID=CAMNT_0020854311 /DNA_START=51 /DNA_END=818 /DNA_ORIENTATION=-
MAVHYWRGSWHACDDASSCRSPAVLRWRAGTSIARSNALRGVTTAVDENSLRGGIGRRRPFHQAAAGSQAAAVPIAIGCSSVVMACRSRRHRRHAEHGVNTTTWPVASVAAKVGHRRDFATTLCIALGVSFAPQRACAGPFIAFLSDILPVREAQRAVAKFDFALRDGYNEFVDAVQTRTPVEEVPDAPGAEDSVFTAADAALLATVGSAAAEAAARRAEELVVSEARRLRGRAAAGAFESDRLGSTTTRLAARTD